MRRAEVKPDLMAGAWPSKPRIHHSHWRTGCPRKGLGLSLWWVGSLQQRVIRSPSQQLGLILQTLRGLWVWQQSVHSSRSLGQGQTDVLAPLPPKNPQTLTSVNSSCGSPVSFPFFLSPPPASHSGLSRAPSPHPEPLRKSSRGCGECGRVEGTGETESNQVEKFIQVNGREYGQGTVSDLDPRPPISAACLLCGLGKFSFPSDLQLLHLHSGGLGTGEHQRRCG